MILHAKRSMQVIRGGHFRTTFRTSAPRTGAEPQFRCGIDGAEPAEKEGAECWRVRNHPKLLPHLCTDRKLFPF